MADDCDLASAKADRFVEDSLRRHALRRQARPGRSACVDCGEPIAPAQQAMGADRCVDCQCDVDLRNRNRLVR
jgi:RNA polymerase-binding transcription factor DksA